MDTGTNWFVDGIFWVVSPVDPFLFLLKPCTQNRTFYNLSRNIGLSFLIMNFNQKCFFHFNIKRLL